VDSQEEFLSLFLRHQAEIRAFIGSIVRDRTAREDVQQEVALVLWKEFARYDRSRSFGAWARGIAANKLMQRFDQASRWPVQLSPSAMAAVLQAFDRIAADISPRTDALEHCLATLPEKSRQLLALRYGQALKLDQIAQRVNSTTAAIHKALSRIRLRLLDCIQRRLGSPGESTDELQHG
jgi:RNA polymerase sigma-70 factor (ECF subfamily)